VNDDSVLTHNSNIDPDKSNNDKVISVDVMTSNDGLKSNAGNAGVEAKAIEDNFNDEDLCNVAEDIERFALFNRLVKPAEVELNVSLFRIK
jgi:hypothetical protein